METALLPDERTNLVSTNRLGHGWAYQKLANQSQDSANQQPILSAIRLINNIYFMMQLIFYACFKKFLSK